MLMLGWLPPTTPIRARLEKGDRPDVLRDSEVHSGCPPRIPEFCTAHADPMRACVPLPEQAVCV